MAYDEVLAQRILDLLHGEAGVTSKKMFGGLGLMLDGHMALAAASAGSLMVRVDPSRSADLLSEHVEPMQMNGRSMNGWLLVDREVLADDADLRVWVDRGLDFVRTLPPKEA